jgi:hypothetical protein
VVDWTSQAARAAVVFLPWDHSTLVVRAVSGVDSGWDQAVEIPRERSAVIQLEPNFELVGRLTVSVVDRRGQPVGGVPVTLRGPLRDDDQRGRHRPPATVRVVTIEDGTVACDVALGRYLVSLSDAGAPGEIEADVRQRRAETTLTLQADMSESH